MEHHTCPICNRFFIASEIEAHANRCIFLSSNNDTKRPTHSSCDDISLQARKKSKAELSQPESSLDQKENKSKNLSNHSSSSNFDVCPLAEQMRPTTLDEYAGQEQILGSNKLLRQLLLKKDIPSMIFWGPPGCGKTSLANIISKLCNNESNLRFVKLSATMVGINDVKEIVKVAKNDVKFKRKTILFMDEIHRFNKMQQDTFLPHIESGTISLVGATTENPSFSLNSALLSRCKVIVFEKLSTENVNTILSRALQSKFDCLITSSNMQSLDLQSLEKLPRIIIEKESVDWLSEICDGDARTALNCLQLAIQSKDPGDNIATTGSGKITLEDIRDGIKRSHVLYDRKGEEHYNMISALHKSIRASDDNAALYWVTRMMQGGEDPLYIARRLIRMAGEDIGLADPMAINLAVSCMQGCQSIGMPECDVLLAQCAVYLARTKKNTEVYRALLKCKANVNDHKGPLPSVPLHLRNAPTKLMTNLGYGRGYNTLHKDVSNITYMPEGMEEMNFFT